MIGNDFTMNGKVEEMKLDGCYISPYCIPNTKNQKCVSTNNLYVVLTYGLLLHLAVSYLLVIVSITNTC